MFHRPSTRRRFLQATGAAATTGLAARLVRPAYAAQPEIRVAFIGVGGRGGRNLKTIAEDPGVKVVALCDVNQRHLDTAHQQFPGAKGYRDFRQMYHDASDFDAVVVSTAEHTHAYATLPALRLGKHVYCEKPLTHNVVEARLITEEAKKAGVVTQMGTQMHATENYHRVVELVQSGSIGPVREVHVWVSRAWGLQSEEQAKANKDVIYVTERPKEAMDPPPELDWDLWLGPAAWRPYHEVYFPGPKWYRWWDFGNGTMSDLGSHWNDLPFWALKLDAPLSIEGIGEPAHPEIAPASMTAVYEYGPRGDLPACKLTWYQGTHQPALLREGKIPEFKSGVLFVGDDGMLLADYQRHLLLPEDKYRDFVKPAPFIPDSPGHHEEWLQAIRTGGQTGSPFSYAGPLTEANHLGNVAFRAGKKILWDSKNLRITNDEATNRFLTRTPREGWHL
jgi:predicted dehydrogenase